MQEQYLVRIFGEFLFQKLWIRLAEIRLIQTTDADKRAISQLDFLSSVAE